jgi:hypothetical protein
VRVPRVAQNVYVSERERERSNSLKFQKKAKEIETRMNDLYKTRKRTMFLERKGEGKKESYPGADTAHGCCCCRQTGTPQTEKNEQGTRRRRLE